LLPEFRTDLRALETQLRAEIQSMAESGEASLRRELANKETLAIVPAGESVDMICLRENLEALGVQLRAEIEKRVDFSEVVLREEFAERLPLAVPGDPVGPHIRDEIITNIQACKEVLRREFSQYIGSVEVELRKSVILRSGGLGDVSSGSRIPATLSEVVVPVQYDEIDNDPDNPLSRNRMERGRAFSPGRPSVPVCGMFPALQEFLSPKVRGNVEGIEETVEPGDVVRL